ELIGAAAGRAVVVAGLQLADAVPGAPRSAPSGPAGGVAPSLLSGDEGTKLTVHPSQQGTHRRLALEQGRLLGVEAGDGGAPVGQEALERRPLGAEVLACRHQFVGDGAVLAGGER